MDMELGKIDEVDFGIEDHGIRRMRMSNPRKDARWQLAFDIADAIQVNWDTSDYAAHTLLLDVAEDVLDYFPEAIRPLADRFTNDR